MSTDKTQEKDIISTPNTNPAQQVKPPQLPTKIEYTKEYTKEKENNPQKENNQ